MSYLDKIVDAEAERLITKIGEYFFARRAQTAAGV